MSGLDDIAIEVANAGAAEPTAQVTALLNEIDNHLRRMLDEGASASIDLRSLPLLPQDYDALVEALGDGEVTAIVEALGPTTVRETAVPGVWWVTHRNAHEEVIAELIEIAEVPEILRPQYDDLREAPQHLQQRVAKMNQADN